MTTNETQLFMLGLGVVAFLLVAGALSARKTYSSYYRGRRWGRGLLAGAIVALSPFSRFWKDGWLNLGLLGQSLLVSAIGLLLLYIFVSIRRTLRDSRESKAELTYSTSELKAGTLATTQAVATNDVEESALDAQFNALDDSISGPVTDEKLKAADTLIDDSVSLDTASGAELPNEYTPDTNISQRTDEFSPQDFDDAIAIDDAISVDGLAEQAPIDELSSIHGVSGTVDLKPDTAVDYANAANDRASDAIDDALSTPVTADLDDDFLQQFTQENSPHVSETFTDTTSNEYQHDLDLSDSEQQFAEALQQNNDVELPEGNEWLDAARDTTEPVDLSEETLHATSTDVDTDVIADAEFIEVEDDTIEAVTSAETTVVEQIDTADNKVDEVAMLDADSLSEEPLPAADLEVDAMHAQGSATEQPDSIQTDTVNTDLPADTDTTDTDIADATVSDEVELPETLETAMLATKRAALELDENVFDLEAGMTQLAELRVARIDAEQQNQRIQADIVKQKDDVIKAEDQARQAAESVIAVQTGLIAKAKQQQALAIRLIAQERKQIAQQKIDIIRSRDMAKKAAILARQAAIAQQKIRGVAVREQEIRKREQLARKREQQARLKSEESTRRAVTIARNAISALAAEEKKRVNTRH